VGLLLREGEGRGKEGERGKERGKGKGGERTEGKWKENLPPLKFRSGYATGCDK